jgi:hypothetical protein
MLGAIAGDVIGSVHESAATKYKRFPLFVPDSTFTALLGFLWVKIAFGGRRQAGFDVGLHETQRFQPFSLPPKLSAGRIRLGGRARNGPHLLLTHRDS